MFNQAQFLEDLKTFIGFRTVVHHNPREFHEAHAWIKSFFEAQTTDFVELEYNGYLSLIIKPKGSPRPRLLGDGHIDVVPGEAHLFGLRQVNGLIYGRGVADMKTQCLMMMTVLRALIAEGNHHDFWLLLTEDEEAGSENGVAKVVDYLCEQDWWPRWVFAPDGGPDFAYVEKEKGVISFTTIMPGQAAHASRPYLGKNAIEQMIAFYQKLQAVYPNPTSPQDWGISLSMTAISGGTAFNQIPDVCRAGFDVRFTEQDNSGDIIAQIKQIAQSFGAEITIDQIGPATYYPREAPVAQRYIDILREVSGKSPRIIHSNGASNGRLYVAKNKETHVLMSNPTVAGSHAVDENLTLGSLEPYYRLVLATAQL